MTELDKDSTNDFEVLGIRHDVKALFLDTMPKSLGSQSDCVRYMLYLLRWLKEGKIELTLKSVHFELKGENALSYIDGTHVLKQFDAYYKEIESDSEKAK